jgi:acyl-CoA synthetase (NDP forming)
MTSFAVVPAELTSASSLIGSAASVLNGAESAAESAEGMAGAFGGEPIEAAFSAAGRRAAMTINALASTVNTLANCVQAAGEGYLITDHGIIAAAGVPGAVNRQPGAGAPHTLSPTWSRP